MGLAHIGEVPFKDYLQLPMFENSEYGNTKFPLDVHHAAQGWWTSIDYPAHAYASSFGSFGTTFMFKYLLWARQWDKLVLNGDGDAQIHARSANSMPIWYQVLANVTMTKLWSTQDTLPASPEPMTTTLWHLTAGQAYAIVGI